MTEPRRPSLGPLVVIAMTIGVSAAAFAYTAGWFSPERLAPTRLVDCLAAVAYPWSLVRRNGVFQTMAPP